MPPIYPAALRFGRHGNRGGLSISAKSPCPGLPGHQRAHVAASTLHEAQLSSGHRGPTTSAPRMGGLPLDFILPALFGEQGFCSCLGFVLKMNVERKRKQRSEKAGQISLPTRRTAVKLINIAPRSPRNLLFSKRGVNSRAPCMWAGLWCLQEGRF